MQINSINTNLAAFSAQTNIRTAQSDNTASVARLSSGNKITQASDDVAGLSIGTSLATNVSTLRTALVNASQGISLLSVADSALSQITEILQRQKAIAVQAGSGTLGNTERAFLDAEFQALVSEVDRIAGNTNFNGVKLINGGLSQLSSLNASTTNATQASATINFTGNFANGESVVIGGVAFSGTTTTSNITSTNTLFEIGANLSETLDNLAAKLQSLSSNPTYSASIGDVTFTASSSSLLVTARSGGELPSSFTVNTVAAKQTIATGDVDATNTSANVVVTLANHGYAVGQKVIITSSASDDTVGGIDTQQLYGVITAATSGTFTIVTADASVASSTAGSSAAASVQLATANYDGAIDGKFTGTSISLFTGTAFASASTVVSANTATSTFAFQNGDSITAKVNGITKTLYTVGTAGDGGAKTVQNIVDGINANKDATGVGAQLELLAGGTYNIKLNFNTPVTNVLIDLGTNYNSTTYNLAGDRLDDTLSATVPVEGTANAATLRKSLFASAYVNAIDGGDIITAASLAATVTAGTPAADSAPFRVGDNLTVSVNGVQKVLHTFIAADGLDDIIASINAKTADTGVFATVTGTASNYNLRLYVEDPTGGIVAASSGAGLYVAGSIAANTNNVATAATARLTRNTVSGLAGGVNDGIAAGSVTVSGSVGNNVLADLGTQKANSSVILTQNAGTTSTLTIAGQLFRFTEATTGAAPNEILIGANIKETIDNAINTLNSYVNDGYATGDVAYQLGQINFTRDGNTLKIEGKGTGNVTNLAGSATANSITIANLTGGTVTQATLNNASTTFGVDASGVTNANFSGAIKGFSATYTGTADTVNLSVTVGGYTYSASNVDLTVSSDTTIRLYSNEVAGKNGGYFDIQLKAGSVSSFNNQTAANAVADRLNSAFATLSFQQERNVENYTAGGSIIAGGASIGSLLGSSITAQLSSFDNVKLTDIAVTAPNGSTTDAKITLTINGVEFSTATGITDKLGANQTYTLLSADDPNQFITFTTGDTTIDLSSSVKAVAFEDALKEALGLSDGSNAALNFQVGTNTSDSLSISISDAGTGTLYNGLSLNVLTSESAAIAVGAIDTAIQNVTSVRAQVGAIQSRFNFAAANIESSIQNQDAARGTLLDTDIADESTAYAISQVKLQAGISVLAQANQALQSLLKLIG